MTMDRNGESCRPRDTLGVDTLGVDTLGVDTLGVDTLGVDTLGVDTLGVARKRVGVKVRATTTTTTTATTITTTRDDLSLLAMVRQGAKRRERDSRTRRDLVFTHKFSAFDARNEQAATSPFHGFFTLFWMAVAVFMVKTGADNWARHGSPLAGNEIMAMFGLDAAGLLVAEALMCTATGVSWLLQRAVAADYVDWDRSGWVLQNLWQAVWFGGAVGLTMMRGWPWSHSIFFTLHTVVLLMKQHSYAFGNGNLSSMHRRRARLLRRLEELKVDVDVDAEAEAAEPLADNDDQAVADRIAQAMEKGEPLDDQAVAYAGLLAREAEALGDELRRRAGASGRAWPHNLTVANFVEFNMLPTLVYELEYPRTDRIDWGCACEKLVACFGVILVMIMVSQSLIYPVVMETVRMREAGLGAAERAAHFPRVLGDLVFPFTVEYLLAWYLIWETILNLLAELTRFADRGFYEAWWNSASWDQFARDWNRPVHSFLLRHVYHGAMSTLHVDRRTAALMTFFLSSCMHELLMWCIFKKVRGYLLVLQMSQLPLVSLSRTRWLRDKATVGNILFWAGLVLGPSVLCSLYLVL